MTAALNVFNDEPEAVTLYCKQILAQWEKDLIYRIEKKLPQYSGYICKAMRHPDLQDIVKTTAANMLQKEQEQPGFLDEELYQEAQNVLKGNFLPWAG